MLKEGKSWYWDKMGYWGAAKVEKIGEGWHGWMTVMICTELEFMIGEVGRLEAADTWNELLLHLLLCMSIRCFVDC